MNKKLKIWFVGIGEIVPFDGDFQNLHRCGQFAHAFSLINHDVTWFTSNFNHFTKKKITINSRKQFSNNFQIFFLDTKIYKKNISFSRFISHYLVAKKFKNEINSISEKPDIIYASFPTIELAYEATKYAKRNNIPIIVDIRDLWPDIFLTAFPKILYPLANVSLFFWYLQRRFIFNNANSIIAISDGYLKFVRDNSKRKHSGNDKVIFKSFKPSFNKPKKTNSEKLKIVYLGAISRNKLNLNPVLNVFNKLNSDYELIICGDGDDLDYFRRNSSKNVIFKGFVNKNEFTNIVSQCDLGIVPLHNRFDFEKAIVNKAIEYLSYKIPILSSLDGDLQDFIEKNNIGFTYSSEKELKEIIVKIKNNKNIIKELSYNASNVFNKKFDFNNNFKSLEKHFLNILQNNY